MLKTSYLSNSYKKKLIPRPTTDNNVMENTQFGPIILEIKQKWNNYNMCKRFYTAKQSYAFVEI